MTTYNVGDLVFCVNPRFMGLYGALFRVDSLFGDRLVLVCVEPNMSNPVCGAETLDVAHVAHASIDILNMFTCQERLRVHQWEMRVAEHLEKRKREPPPAQVTRDGTLRLPQRIQQALGVENGGGVSFVDKGNGVVEVMSDDVFLEKYTGEAPR